MSGSDTDPGSITRVALVTGGSNGIGAAVVRALAARGNWHIVVADIDEAAGSAVADEVGGLFVRTDVADPAANVAAVEAAEKTYGRLDFAHLNAGIAAAEGSVETIDLTTYRRVTGINLDGVFFGLQAVVPAMRRAGGGSIVATASLAGLVPTPLTPVYALTKHAVVGLVRSVAVALESENISVSAVAPGFAETAIIAPMKAAFDSSGFPLLTAEEVADVVLQAADGPAGAVYPIQPGRTAEPYRFRGVPGPRVAGKEGIAPPAEGAPAADVPADGSA